MSILDDIATVFTGGTIGPEPDLDPDAVYGPASKNIERNPDGDYDGDGVRNDVEIHGTGTNPQISDTDGDGLSDGEEFKLHTGGNDRDTDNDGLEDGNEVTVRKTDPTKKDSDGDGESDYDEFHVLKPIQSTGPSPFGGPPAAPAAAQTLFAH